MARTSPQDLRPPPRRHLRKLRTAQEPVEALAVPPLAQDQVAALRRHVLVHLRLDVPGDALQVLDDREEALLEFLLLAGNDVVLHADGGHGAMSFVTRDPTTTVPPRETPGRRCRRGGSTSPGRPAAV